MGTSNIDLRHLQSVANRHKMIMILHKTEQKSFFFAKNMYLCCGFRKPMRKIAEMCCEALLSRHILTKENNVKTIDFLGGSNNIATLSGTHLLTYNSLYIIKKREYSRQDMASFAEMQVKPQCFLSPS